MAEKGFTGAPFGIQSERFTVAGVHPKRKIPGSFTQVGYDRGYSSDLNCRLGPGTYNITTDSSNSKQVKTKVPGVDWARQLEVEKLAAQPHLLYREQWEENRMLKRKLGPGSYDIKDFIQLANQKSKTVRGVCDSLAPRFEKNQEGSTPGPGTYGFGGVPHGALEQKAKKSFGTKGMLELGGREKNVTSVGSNLGPGTYNFKSGTEEMLSKVTSLKGPYKLFSGDRNKPVSVGHFAAPKNTHIGPGQYEFKSFVDDLKSSHRQYQGRFSKMAQYPEVPTDRILLFSKTYHPKMKDTLGPGAYDIQQLSRPTSINPPGFLSASRRDDKMAQKFFTRSFNPVGPGRYDIQKFEEAQDINGHSSVFKSKTGRPNLQLSKVLHHKERQELTKDQALKTVLKERIGGQSVKINDQVFGLHQTGAPRSITVM